MMTCRKITGWRNIAALLPLLCASPAFSVLAKADALPAPTYALPLETMPFGAAWNNMQAQAESGGIGVTSQNHSGDWGASILVFDWVGKPHPLSSNMPGRTFLPVKNRAKYCSYAKAGSFGAIHPFSLYGIRGGTATGKTIPTGTGSGRSVTLTSDWGLTYRNTNGHKTSNITRDGLSWRVDTLALLWQTDKYATYTAAPSGPWSQGSLWLWSDSYNSQYSTGTFNVPYSSKGTSGYTTVPTLISYYNSADPRQGGPCSSHILIRLTDPGAHIVCSDNLYVYFHNMLENFVIDNAKSKSRLTGPKVRISDAFRVPIGGAAITETINKTTTLQNTTQITSGISGGEPLLSLHFDVQNNQQYSISVSFQRTYTFPPDGLYSWVYVQAFDKHTQGWADHYNAHGFDKVTTFSIDQPFTTNPCVDFTDEIESSPDLPRY